MNSVLWWLAQNAVATAVLAPLVAVGCWMFRHRPAVQHLLWAVVLVKFLTPPIVVWPWALSSFIAPSVPAATMEWAPANVEAIEPVVIVHAQPVDADRVVRTVTIPVAEAPAWTFAEIGSLTLLATWTIGAAIYFLRQVRRIRSYSAIVRRGGEPSPEMSAAVAEVAGEMRMRPPRTVVARGIGSPFVWCVGWLRLVWPDALATSRGIIAHELAHVKRRDHWTSWLTFVAGVVWWWNPIFWFVRRRLHETAEMACDAQALRACSRTPAAERRREYAETLLELSAGFQTGTPAVALGVSAGASSSFERRLKMILSDRVNSKTSLGGLAVAVLLAALALPGWSMDPIAFTVTGEAGAALDVQKQIDDAIKLLEKADPKNVEEAKKQIDEARKQLEAIRKGMAQPPMFKFAVAPPAAQLMQTFGQAQAWPGQPFAAGAQVVPAAGQNFILGLVDPASGRFGAVMHRPDPLVVSQLQLPANQGQVLVQVMPELPAAKAGLKKYDILLELAGKAVPSDHAAFVKAIGEIKADADVTVLVLRDGKKETIKVLKLPEANAAFQVAPFNAAGFQIAPPGGQAVFNVPVPPPAVFARPAAPPVPPLAGVVRVAPANPAGQVDVVKPVAPNFNVQPLPAEFGKAVQWQAQNVIRLEAAAPAAPKDGFALQFSSGKFRIEICGKVENGKATPSQIHIEDGGLSLRTQSLQQVPAEYLPMVNRLLENVK